MSTLLGIIVGLSLLTLAMGQGGGTRIFLNLDALMIVLGGTAAATLISFPFSAIVNFFTLTAKLFGLESRTALEKLIYRLLILSQKAQQDSIFALEEEAAREKDRYIRLGLTLLVRDAKPARIARRFAVESEGVRARHKEGIQLFGFMARISPAFGLVGTLIGLVNMLRGVGEKISPETLGPAMAVALVTTLYGALMAFFLFLPASEKLKAFSEREQTRIMMVREAMLMIREGESSRDVEDMLQAYLPQSRRKSVLGQVIEKLMK